jgi:glycosyltransferase involved in cell wall biosynthesis
MTVTLLIPPASGRMETGIGRYCAQLLTAFDRMGIRVEKRALRHHLFSVGQLEMGYYVKFLLYAAKFRLQRRGPKRDGIVHSFHPMIVPPDTSVLTVWDLIPFDPAQRHFTRRPPLYSLIVLATERNLLEYPQAYVTISDVVRQEMHKYFSIPLDRIYVAKPAVDMDLFRPVSNPDVPFGHDKVNVLHVGTAVERKNILGIVEALGALGPERFRLVRVGPPTDPAYVERYGHRAKELGLEVLELGYASDETLRICYGAADLVLFPSLAEGAGLPPLEAMAAGTNVVVSDLPVHREMCGEAAFYCETDPESIARAIDRALASPIPRETLRAHVSSWTWDDVAQVHRTIYERLGERF